MGVGGRQQRRDHIYSIKWYKVGQVSLDLVLKGVSNLKSSEPENEDNIKIGNNIKKKT